MAHTNSTPNYNLPQFVTTDKPAWLTDINGAFSAIDTGIDAAKDTADAAQSDATQALTDASTANTLATAANGKSEGSLASIAPAFSATNTYNVGDRVIYNSLLYVCTVAIVTPGPWTGSTNWTRTTCDSISKVISANVSSLDSSKLAKGAIKSDTYIGSTDIVGMMNPSISFNNRIIINAIKRRTIGNPDIAHVEFVPNRGNTGFLFYLYDQNNDMYGNKTDIIIDYWYIDTTMLS